MQGDRREGITNLQLLVGRRVCREQAPPARPTSNASTVRQLLRRTAGKTSSVLLLTRIASTRLNDIQDEYVENDIVQSIIMCLIE